MHDRASLPHVRWDCKFHLKKNLKKINDGKDAYTQLDLINCPGCEYSNYLSLKSINVEMDAKGKEKKDEEDIVENYILTTDSYRTISQAW